MANGKTYGIDFPFNISDKGQYLKLTETANDEIRANLIHLLLTKKGSRYFLPDFGTNLYGFIFDPLDSPTFTSIESDIKESCEKYLPQLRITNIEITALESEETDSIITTNGNDINREFLLPSANKNEYTAKVRIEYAITNDVFNSKDFLIINI
jgi:phage baseplate assembly protein W